MAAMLRVPEKVSDPAKGFLLRTGVVTADTTPTTLLWFKQDLRVDDHEGLSKTAGANLVPVVCIDPGLYAPLLWSPAGPEVLAWALGLLRNELRSLGSDLVVRVGRAEDVLPTLAAQCGASRSIAEHEVETRWQDASERVLGTLGVPHESWSVAAWDPSSFKVNFREWKKSRKGPLPPLDPPASLPPLPQGVDAGPLPNAALLRSMLTQAALDACEPGPVRELCRSTIRDVEASPDTARVQRVLELGEGVQLLRAYISQLQDPSKAEPRWREVLEEIAALEVPSVDGFSFTTTFSTKLNLGVLSRRRLLAEVSTHSAVLSRGVALFPASGALPLAVRAAGGAAEKSDFHWQLAEQGDMAGHVSGASVCCWRWRGFLTDYSQAKASTPRPGAPAVLLVHGFGAFGEQWRGNLGPLASAGLDVYAPTFPGFGRSEKASVPYSQDLWRDFLRDFVIQVVGRPVVVVGNSIGGFIASALAADYPDIVAGLVLVNSAGPVDPAFDAKVWAASVRAPPPRWLAFGISWALIFYLERSIPQTLKWLYPVNPARADDWLFEEIYRAACDPGALDVFKAVFYLPPPRALNYLVGEKYRGPALVLQGAKDPLNDAPGRAKMLGELCSNVDVELVNGGHCPHDEVPELINAKLLEWMERRVMAQQAPLTTQAAI